MGIPLGWQVRCGGKGLKRDRGVIKVKLVPRESGRTAVVLNGEDLACGRGAVVCAAARRLVGLSYNLRDRLEAWRGDVLCLSGLLGTFAKLTIREEGGPYFVRWAPIALGGVQDRAKSIRGTEDALAA